MKIILNKDVKNLGEEGDICTVADGYARNFLLPKLLAVPYNKMNLNNLKAREKAILARKEEKRKEALGLKEKLEKQTEVSFEMPTADGGRLFGAVTNATIAEALAHEGINIERKRIEVPGRVIKHVGNYQVKVRLYDEQVASLKILITAMEDPRKVAKAAEEAASEESTESPVEEAEGGEA